MKKFFIILFAVIIIGAAAYIIHLKKNSVGGKSRTNKAIETLLKKSPIYVPLSTLKINYSISSKNEIAKIIIGKSVFDVDSKTKRGTVDSIPPGNYPIMVIDSNDQIHKTDPGFVQVHPGNNTLEIEVVD